MPSTPKPFIPVENCMSVEMLFEIQGQKVENVLHVDCGHSPILADVATVGSALVGWWNSHGKTITPAGLSLMGLKIKSLATADGFQIVYNTGLPVSGVASGSMLPNNVTVAIRFGTAWSGRSSTGRLFHLGLVSDFVTAGLLNVSGINALKTNYEALVTALTTAGMALQVVSYVADNAWRTVGQHRTIETVSVDANSDSQRRRLPGRGR